MALSGVRGASWDPVTVDAFVIIGPQEDSFNCRITEFHLGAKLFKCAEEFQIQPSADCTSRVCILENLADMGLTVIKRFAEANQLSLANFFLENDLLIVRHSLAILAQVCKVPQADWLTTVDNLHFEHEALDDLEFSHELGLVCMNSCSFDGVHGILVLNSRHR